MQTESGEKRMIGTILAVSAIFVFSFIHMVNWDKHSLVIVPLKVKQVIGLASAQDLRTIADICTDQLKYACVDDALADLVADEASAQDLFRLGELRRKLNEHSTAVTAYESAVQKMAESDSPELASDIHFGLARSYEKLNQFENAAHHYESAIQAKPGVIQITVTESYINMLKAAGRLDIAEKVVQEARKRGQSEKLFSNIL